MRGKLQIRENRLFAPMLGFGALVCIQLAFGRTTYAYETQAHALLYAAYGLLCFLIVQCLRRTWQIKAVTVAFTLYGTGLAIFALLQSITANGKLYWVRTPSSGGWIYGPYVNHNHYAGLMEMLAPIPLVMALSHYTRGLPKIMAALAAALMGSTIFFSGSRSGMLAFAVQIGVLAGFLLRRHRNRKPILGFGIFALLVAILLVWMGGAELTTRLASIHAETQAELSGGTRLAIDRDTLKMFARRPILGWGLGTFPEDYPQFRSFYTNFRINAAHNDYLQNLVEMGAAGFLVMLWFLTLVYRGALHKIDNWPADINGAIALAAILGVTGILVHSLTDFNLQIPANAALFYVLCTIAAMEPRFGVSRRDSDDFVA